MNKKTTEQLAICGINLCVSWIFHLLALGIGSRGTELAAIPNAIGAIFLLAAIAHRESA